MSQGGQANKTGNVLEQMVVGVLRTHDFNAVMFSEYKKTPAKFGTELLLMNVPYTTLYNRQGYTEFLLRSKNHGLNIRIECKWQQTTGSVDEKLPYTYLSCISGMEENDVIILIDGPGFRPGSIEWLIDAAKERKYIPEDKPLKNIQIMSIRDFMAWTNTIFK